jgi:hypothetical protein
MNKADKLRKLAESVPPFTYQEVVEWAEFTAGMGRFSTFFELRQRPWPEDLTQQLESEGFKVEIGRGKLNTSRKAFVSWD